MAVVLREAGPPDAEALFAIQRQTSLVAYAGIFPPERFPFPDAEVRAEWEERLADVSVTTLLAERDGEPLGYAAFAPELLVSLFVLPAEQGRGVGSRLHDGVLAAQREHGAATCRLWVLEQNEAGRRFYERRGWRPDGEARVARYPPHPRVLRYSIDVASGSK